MIHITQRKYSIFSIRTKSFGFYKTCSLFSAIAGDLAILVVPSASRHVHAGQGLSPDFPSQWQIWSETWQVFFPISEADSSCGIIHWRGKTNADEYRRSGVVIALLPMPYISDSRWTADGKSPLLYEREINAKWRHVFSIVKNRAGGWNCSILIYGK